MTPNANENTLIEVGLILRCKRAMETVALSASKAGGRTIQKLGEERLWMNEYCAENLKKLGSC